jgi:AcrR family transcriptional regulator
VTARVPDRDTYRHGDLRRALVDAGIDLARTGGPTAVVLREATRRVGVSPNAAYRHFVDRAALLGAVCDAAQAALARAIEDEQERVRTSRGGAARGRFLAVGTGYIRFARTEPGLFRAAFSVPANLDGRSAPARAGRRGLTPFQLLSAALDDLVQAGDLPAARRRDAEFLAWGAVHGLATLLVDGPLRGLGADDASRLADRMTVMVADGL